MKKVEQLEPPKVSPVYRRQNTFRRTPLFTEDHHLGMMLMTVMMNVLDTMASQTTQRTTA